MIISVWVDYEISAALFDSHKFQVHGIYKGSSTVAHHLRLNLISLSLRKNFVIVFLNNFKIYSTTFKLAEPNSYDINDLSP